MINLQIDELIISSGVIFLYHEKCDFLNCKDPLRYFQGSF